MFINFVSEFNFAVNDLTITSISAATKIPNLLVNRGMTLHTPQNCLSCYKMIIGHKTSPNQKSSPIPKSLRDVIHSFNVGPIAPNKSMDIDMEVSVDAMDKNDKKETQNSNSNESKASENLEDKNSSDNFVLEVIKRKEVLKLVGCMNATVGAKTAEQGLLRYQLCN